MGCRLSSRWISGGGGGGRGGGRGKYPRVVVVVVAAEIGAEKVHAHLVEVIPVLDLVPFLVVDEKARGLVETGVDNLGGQTVKRDIIRV